MVTVSSISAQTGANTKNNMHLNRATLLALASSLAGLTTQSAVIPRQNGVYCQTSTASPLTGDITEVINQMKAYDPSELCRQTNGKASDCTTLLKHKSAAISICGQTDAKGEGTHCQVLANYATTFRRSAWILDLDEQADSMILVQA